MVNASLPRRWTLAARHVGLSAHVQPARSRCRRNPNAAGMQANPVIARQHTPPSAKGRGGRCAIAGRAQITPPCPGRNHVNAQPIEPKCRRISEEITDQLIRGPSPTMPDRCRPRTSAVLSRPYIMCTENRSNPRPAGAQGILAIPMDRTNRRSCRRSMLARCRARRERAVAPAGTTRANNQRNPSAAEILGNPRPDDSNPAKRARAAPAASPRAAPRGCTCQPGPATASTAPCSWPCTVLPDRP